MKNKAFTIFLITAAVVQIATAIYGLCKGQGAFWVVILLWAICTLGWSAYAIHSQNLNEEYSRKIEWLESVIEKQKSTICELSYQNNALRKK